MDASFVEPIAYGLILGGGTALALNSLSYLTTLVEGRENWDRNEFQDICDKYWKKNPIRDDIEGLKRVKAEVVYDILYKPGRYLACKHLSQEGYKVPRYYNEGQLNKWLESRDWWDDVREDSPIHEDSKTESEVNLL